VHEGLERILLAEAKALHGPQGCPRSHRRGGPHLSVRSPRSFPAGESESASRDDHRASV
jgi:hypothetical protein